MKRLLRSRTAVSPVIAAVLMIMVAVVGMSILFAFFVNYARDFQLGQGSAVLESMVVENVWVKGSTNVEIWVYNVGKVDFNVTNVFINDFQGAFTSDSPHGYVSVEAHGRLVVTPSEPMEKHIDYVFKIVTTRGSAVEGSYRWE